MYKKTVGLEKQNANVVKKYVLIVVYNGMESKNALKLWTMIFFNGLQKMETLVIALNVK